MAENNQLDEVGKNIRAMLIATPDQSVTTTFLLREYLSTLGEPLPFRELGFANPLALFRQLDEFITVRNGRNGRGVDISPVVSENLSHINTLVCEQRQSNRRRRMPPRRQVPALQATSNASSLFQYGPGALTPCGIPNRRSRPPRKNTEPVFFSNEERSDNRDCFFEAYEPKEDQEDQRRPGKILESYEGSQMQKHSEESFSSYLKPSSSENSLESEIIKPVPVTETVPYIHWSLPLFSDQKKHIEEQDEKFFAINHRLKKRIMDLLKENPDGILCRKFTQKFRIKYNQTLKFEEYGFVSMREMARALTDIFACEFNEDNELVLFDAPSYSSYQRDDNYRSSNKIGYLDNDKSICYKELEEVKQSESTSEYSSINPSEEEKIGLFPLQYFLTSNAMSNVWKQFFSEDVVDPLFCYADFDVRNPDKMNVYISTCYSPTAFWLQNVEQVSDLDNLVHYLQLFYASDDEQFNLEYNIIVPGLAVVAFYKSNWNRAIIQKKSGGRITVVMVDFGDEVELELNCLRKLHKQFSHQPIFAIESTLCGAEKIKQKFFQDHAFKKFHELLQNDINDQFIVKISEIMLVNSRKKLKVVLYSPTYGDINQAILDSAAKVKEVLLQEEDRQIKIEKQINQFMLLQIGLAKKIKVEKKIKFFKARVKTPFFEGELILVLYKNEICLPLMELFLFFTHIRNNEYIQQILDITKNFLCLVDNIDEMQEVKETLDERATRFFKPESHNPAGLKVLVPLKYVVPLMENFMSVLPQSSKILNSLLNDVTPDVFH